MGIDGRHENRAGHRVDRRHLAERTRAQRSPQAGLLQVVTHRLGIERRQLRGVIAGELDGVIALQIDHHRLQHALLAAMDGTDHASTRRGEMHARVFLVGEQDLAKLDPVAHLDRHGRLHPVIVAAEHSHAAYGACRLDALFGRAGKGQIQPAFDLYH